MPDPYDPFAAPPNDFRSWFNRFCRVQYKTPAPVEAVEPPEVLRKDFESYIQLRCDQERRRAFQIVMAVAGDLPLETAEAIAEALVKSNWRKGV
ncbi:hypothetical protein KIKIMORA_02470 [Brevundimonas phage vB_BpoS-Kikimora]|uniref:Uncharacterized protein n=1 Tax=Brevundimonas phage vB_BpoS-Kikimora TaxID=2948601 RepID=A0A9E7MRN9_9CAUD|nr:hypothetical protein KIKIMORA_02470 [Brevundimonas phage vB_BpoS-Kikimora]